MGQSTDRQDVQRYRTLIELSTLVNSSLDIADIEQRAIEAATEVTCAEAGSLLFVDESTDELYFDVAVGAKGDRLRTVRFRKGQGIAGWVATHQEPLIVNDVGSDPRFLRLCDEKSGFTTRNMICTPVPVKSSSCPIGVLQVINKKHDAPFDDGDLEVLTALANQVAVAVGNARAYEELNETFLTVVRALADTIVKRDPHTGGHTRRVMNHSLAIGKMMGLAPQTMHDLRFAALLHDIGKIGIRDEVLIRGDNLDADELRVTKIMHTEYGAQILSNIKQMQGIVPGVRHHHERYDGRGVPDALKGDEIPLIARIIAVADTFDAITTDRPSKDGLGVADARHALENKAGSQLDPHVVHAFLKACDALEIAL